MHAPPPQLCTPPTTMHPCKHAHPSQPCTPPATMHAPHNHACPPTTTHAPLQSHMPPSNHACPPATTHAPPVNRMTNRCKNITLPQTSFAGGNKTLVCASVKKGLLLFFIIQGETIRSMPKILYITNW